MNSRKNYIDILKGISIIAIVLLHYEEGIIPEDLNIWIGSFMIVAFYFSSGWLFGLTGKEMTVRVIISKRLRSLGIPYLYFSIIIILFDSLLVIFDLKEFQTILVDLYKTLTLRGIGPLWFLPALFGGEVIFIYLKNKSSSRKVIAISLTILYFFVYYSWSNSLGHLDITYRIIDAPFRTILNIMNAWLVVAAGYYIYKKFGIAIQNLSRSNLFLTASIFILVSFFATTLWKYMPNFIYSVLFQPFFVSIICPFAILLFSILTERLIIHRFFIFWSKNSLILMVTHYSIIMQLCVLFNFYVLGNSLELSGLTAIYYFIISMFFEYLIVVLINSKAKFLLGK